MSRQILNVKNLKKTYHGVKDVEVLKDVSLSLDKGEIVALVGQSGAGKSTLLHCLGLLDSPTSGKIILGREDMSSLNEKKRTLIRRSSMGFVYQFHYLQPEFTALENVMLACMVGGMNKAAAKSRATELLDKMGLSERLNHRPATLSGGEQQRVSIARALANEPLLLLADEPTGNLDEGTSARIFDMLLEVTQEQGVTALIATHNQSLAKRMNRILSLENGYLGV